MIGGEGPDTRGISEIYGIVLIAAFSLLSALVLFSVGFTVVGELTTESTDSVTEDTMRTVESGLDGLASGSETETVEIEFPEDSGESVSANPQEGEINLTVTTNETFWNRTVAEDNGLDRTGSDAREMGTIVQDTDTRGEVAYQGGGLWQRADPDGQTLVLSDPNVELTSTNLDLAVVSLNDTEAITEGSEVQLRRSPNADSAQQFQQFVKQYYTDRYNPSVTAPIRANITIESQFADGWATWAEEELGGNPDAVIYPYDGDENKVRIALGKLGEEPADSRNPAFGDSDILYSGTSDLAYIYYNESVYGAFEEDSDEGPMSPELDNSEFSPPDDEYRLALYNESGQWLIYNNSAPASDRWEVAATGEKANASNTAALNTTAGPGSKAVNPGTNQFFIDPPAWVEESPTTPICVVTNTSDITTAEMREYIDENGEDCLETMVGVDESLVSPIQRPPEFNITLETTDSDLDETYDVGESVEVEVNVSNDGGTTGQAPVGVYIINETNWPHVDASNTTFVNGTAATDLELDPGEATTYEYSFETEYPLVGDNWTVLSAVGGGDSEVVRNETTTSAAFFEVIEPDAQLDVVDVDPQPDPVDSGNTQVVNVTINESAEQISDPVTQYLTLRADGRLVNQTEITYSNGEKSSRLISWEPRDSDSGTVTLEAETYDDNRTATTVVNGPSVDPSNFEVEITGTNSSINETQTLTVDLNVTNTGGVTDTQSIVLHDIYGNPVDTTTLTLNPGQSAYPTLEWQTIYGDNGTGTVEVTSGDDSDTAFVNVTELGTQFRDPVDVAFVLDESGSMSWNDPSNQRIDATRTAVGSLNASLGDQAAWIPYSNDVCIHDNGTFFDGFCPTGPNWTEANAATGEPLTDNFTEFNNTLDTQSSGGTPITAGLQEAESELAGGSNEPYIILLTDGIHNEGPDPVPYAVNNLDDDITVYTVGFGNFDQGTLTQIATQGGTGDGEFYEANNANELTDVFEDITNDITASQTSTYQVNILNTNSPVTEGDTVQVDVNVTNTGADGEDVVLLENSSGKLLDSRLVSLSSGNSTTVSLEWNTTGAGSGSETLEVRTPDDSDSETVTVNSVPPSNPQLNITSLSTSPSSPIADETITVDIGLENTGSGDANDEPVSLSVVDPATGNTIASDTTDVSVTAGNSANVILDWDSDPGDVGTYNLEVETPDDTNTTTVTLDEPQTDLNVSILNTNPDEIRAGGELDVIVELNNTGSDTENGTIVLTDERSSTTVDVAVDVEVSGGDTETRTLTWATRVGDGDENPIPIRASIANTAEDDDTTVTVREADNLDRASVAPGVDPVDINLEEIEVES